jgi:Secretion system C-terminal sorting domain
MKSLFLFFSLLFASQLALAQPLEFAPNPTVVTLRGPLVQNGPLENLNRTSNFYNPSGHLEATLTEVWQNGAWVRDRRTLVSPNADGQPAQITMYQGGNPNWSESQREYFTYDAGGRETAWVRQQNTGSVWIDVARRTSTYNPDGYLLTFLNEYDFAMGGRFEVTNQYDAENRRVDFRWRQLDDNTIFYEQHILHTYDAQGRELTSQSEIKTGSGDWIWQRKTELTYTDADNRVDYVKVWAWNTTTNQWYWPQSEDQAYTYSATEDILTIPAPQTGIFTNYRQITRYNADNQKTKIERESWSNGFQALRLVYQEDFEYNPDGSYSRTGYATRSVDASGSLIPQQEMLYDYAALTDLQTPTLQAELSVFPNPTTDVLQVLAKDVNYSKPMLCALFDQQGRVVMRMALTEGLNTLQVANQPAGTYVLRVEQGGIFKSISVVKQ